MFAGFFVRENGLISLFETKWWRWWESNPRPKWNKASFYECSFLLSRSKLGRNLTKTQNKVPFAEKLTFGGFLDTYTTI